MKTFSGLFLGMCLTNIAFSDNAASAWHAPAVSDKIKNNVLYLPIASNPVRSVALNDTNE